MACTTIDVERPRGRRPAGRLGGLWAALARRLAAARHERRIRRATRDLAALGDHELADIGLSRGEIDYAARIGRPPRRWTDR